MKLKKKEFIRTKDGYIGEIIAINYGTNFVFFERNNKIITTSIDEIVDQQSTPQDLIRIGDYINGYKVNDMDEEFIYSSNPENNNQPFTFKKEAIKTILTKELYDKNILYIYE